MGLGVGVRRWLKYWIFERTQLILHILFSCRVLKYTAQNLELQNKVQLLEEQNL